MGAVKARKLIALTGNDAVAEAMRQINPDVVAAYPITPQTELMHKFAEYVAGGQVNTEFVLVESEHSAMSAAVGASAAGARVVTATSANGLALMWEIVYIAASTRCPIVMAVVNRALSAPINIHCDHSDSMGTRDAGWIHIHSENSQEAYDNAIQAVRIAEHRDVLLPVMVCLDGFILSHTLEAVEVLEDDAVRQFIGEFRPVHNLLDVDNAMTFGPLDFHDYYFEHKIPQIVAMQGASKVIEEVANEFAQLTGRHYQIVEKYKTEDAERIVVALGSTCGTAKVVVDELRQEGEKVGLLKIRVFRPFPYEQVREALSGAKAVAVLDRSMSFGAQSGPVLLEVRAALYDNVSVPTKGYIYGLGGRNVSPSQIRRAFEELKELAKTGKSSDEIGFLGVRE
ncbi:MAG TPA: pyruvate ferredoxin oxidoreductase [Firmicutes bacterium]|nr:pyruvate ferredoxin oxidoreductase [Bacillota bacterium]